MGPFKYLQDGYDSYKRNLIFLIIFLQGNTRCYGTEITWDEAYKKCRSHGREMGDNADNCPPRHDGYWVGFRRVIQYTESNQTHCKINHQYPSLFNTAKMT